MSNIPGVLIIAYRRNQNVIELIETLILSGVSRIYVAIDGPQNLNDSSPHPNLVSQLSVFHDIDSVQLNVWQRESNFGPAVSVITAIEWFFIHEECGIILEDDLKLIPESIIFFSDALTTFANQKSIGIISGSNFWGEIGTHNSLPFSTYPLTWGWATWRDRWELLRKPFFSVYTFDLSSLTILERTYWKTGIENCMERKLDAWDIPFAANFKTLNLKAVLPNRNLVTNVGFDIYAGNTFENVWPLNTPIVRSHSAGKKLAISDSNDITQMVIQDIYRINFRSAFARPLRLAQRIFRFRKKRLLQETLSAIVIPGHKY